MSISCSWYMVSLSICIVDAVEMNKRSPKVKHSIPGKWQHARQFCVFPAISGLQMCLTSAVGNMAEVWYHVNEGTHGPKLQFGDFPVLTHLIHQTVRTGLKWFGWLLVPLSLVHLWTTEQVRNVHYYYFFTLSPLIKHWKVAFLCRTMTLSLILLFYKQQCVYVNTITIPLKYFAEFGVSLFSFFV